MSDPLSRYLARPDADERVVRAAVQSKETSWKSSASEYREWVYKNACIALASQLEEAEGMLLRSICDDLCGKGYSAPGYCPTPLNPACTAIVNRLADLRARYREEAK